MTEASVQPPEPPGAQDEDRALMALRVIGVVLVIIGVFAPILRMPAVGDLSYFNAKRTKAASITLAALGAVGLNASGRVREASAAAAFLTAFLAIECVRNQADLSAASAEVASAFRAHRASQNDRWAALSAGLEWGWALLFIGSLMLTGATLASPRFSTQPQLPEIPPGNLDAGSKTPASWAEAAPAIAVCVAVGCLAVSRLIPGPTAAVPTHVDTVLDLVVLRTALLQTDMTLNRPKPLMHFDFQIKNKGSTSLRSLNGSIVFSGSGGYFLSVPFTTNDSLEPGATKALSMQLPYDSKNWLHSSFTAQRPESHRYHLGQVWATIEAGTQLQLTASSVWSSIPRK